MLQGNQDAASAHATTLVRRRATEPYLQATKQHADVPHAIVDARQ